MNSTVDCVLLLCVLDVHVLHWKEFVCCQLFQQTVRNTWGMLFWRVCHVILCVYVLSSVQESVIVCVCVCRENVCNCQNNDSTTLFLAALAVNWVNSYNYDKSKVQLCLTARAHTQTCNCHTRAPSGWTSRIDRSAIETPVRNLSRFFFRSLLPPLTASFWFFWDKVKLHTQKHPLHAHTLMGWINQLLHLYKYDFMQGHTFVSLMQIIDNSDLSHTQHETKPKLNSYCLFI